MTETALAIGQIFMVIVGVVAVLVLLFVVSIVTGRYAATVWKRLVRTYHLTVIWYWLDRLEQEGTHCFRKADKP